VTVFGRVLRALRARQTERGSVIVEAAIVVPLLIMLTFGAIEYGLAFRDSASIAAATRSGARIASAMPAANCTPALCGTVNSDGFWDASRNGVNLALKDLTHSVPIELIIFQADPTTGKPIGNTSYEACTNCYIYQWNAATKAFNSTTTNNASSYWTAAEQKTDICAGTTDAIGVYIKAKHSFLTGLFGTATTYDHVTVMRLEPAGSDLCS
jgi:hypothetical protein